jgi:hypothetical protein
VGGRVWSALSGLAVVVVALILARPDGRTGVVWLIGIVAIAGFSAFVVLQPGANWRSASVPA